MKLQRIFPIVAVIVAVALVGVYAVHVLTAPKSVEAAPNFTLDNIQGQPFTLSSYQNSSVVVIEFTSVSCSACQVIEKSLQSIYGQYNASGHSTVEIVSIYIEPQFGDTVMAVKDYEAAHNITWEVARDTSTLTVSRDYSVSDIPDVVIVDQHEHVTYDHTGIQTTQQLQSGISNALSGNAAVISIVAVSVFALAAIAGVATFFSPCAFPMFPGYMTLFLGLNATGTEGQSDAGTSYKGAARRAAAAGSVTALGMVIVMAIIGVALVLAAGVVNHDLPYFLLVVGTVLVAMGALLFTNLQYWKIVTPIQNLWKRIRGHDPTSVEAAPVGATGGGLYLKLFSYGMGYAAAAAGCVAPVILAAVVAGTSLGLVGGIVNVAIYSATAAGLMIGVTVALAVAGKTFVNKLKAYTPIIKKISASSLVIVGVYLIYYYYTAWGFPHVGWL